MKESFCRVLFDVQPWHHRTTSCGGQENTIRVRRWQRRRWIDDLVVRRCNPDSEAEKRGRSPGEFAGGRERERERGRLGGLSLFFHPPHHTPACISPGEAAGRERERKVGRLVTVSPAPAPHTRVNFQCASFIDSSPSKKSRSWTGAWWICASQMVAPPDSANTAKLAVVAESGGAALGEGDNLSAVQ